MSKLYLFRDEKNIRIQEGYTLFKLKIKSILLLTVSLLF
jgi:hypothetical protein